MRIAIVAQEFPPETAKGGIGAQAFLKAHGLAARGHDVVVISRSPDGSRSERTDGGVRILRIPGFEKRMPVYTEITDWITYSAEVSVAIQEIHQVQPLDLVEMPEWAAEGYVHLLNRSEWNNIPTVIQIHGPLVMFAQAMNWPSPDSLFYRVGSEMEGLCLRLADAVYSSSAYSADWCVRYHGLDRPPIPVMHTGIDVEHFYPRPVPRESNFTVAFAGKLVRNKGVVDLVAAGCRLRSEFPALRIRLFGRAEPPMRRELESMAATAGCPDLLDFAGFVPREELPAALSRCHLFAAPAPVEGGPGFTYLEAMACGLPVIACSGSGAAEIVVPDANGRLVAPGDVDGCCEAIRHFMVHEREREALGASARHYALKHADSRKCLDRIEVYFQSVWKGIRKSGP